MVYFFKVGALLCTEKFWPILGTLGYFVANLRRFWNTFTGLTNAVQKLTNIRYALCVMCIKREQSDLIGGRIGFGAEGVERCVQRLLAYETTYQ